MSQPSRAPPTSGRTTSGAVPTGARALPASGRRRRRSGKGVLQRCSSCCLAPYLGRVWRSSHDEGREQWKPPTEDQRSDEVDGKAATPAFCQAPNEHGSADPDNDDDEQDSYVVGVAHAENLPALGITRSLGRILATDPRVASRYAEPECREAGGHSALGYWRRYAAIPPHRN
jgi:hypothetical protein